jgi:hypothetical protein
LLAKWFVDIAGGGGGHLGLVGHIRVGNFRNGSEL